MKIHHIRNATCIIESGAHFILVDPMLSDQGALPSFARFRHRPQKNPIVALPENAAGLLDKVTACLITHSQKLGIRALQHTDHLDEPGEHLLREKNIPVITRVQDAPNLRKQGLSVVAALKYWQPEEILEGEITAIPARHGYGWVHYLMANGVGFYLRLPDEPSLYISGDTVYTEDVETALTELKPDIAIMASGSASLDIGGPILMDMDELLRFANTAPGTVIANHLEALNHCPTTRTQLKRELAQQGLLTKVLIPEDGESLSF